METHKMTELDLQRYSGLWYEFARTPLFWETNCDSATAEYIPNDRLEGMKVINRCYDEEKHLLDTRRGKASLTDEPRTLSLIFDDGKPANPYPAPYTIVETDYESFSIVKGDDEPLNAWILTREEYPSLSLIQHVLRVCYDHGIDTEEMTVSGDKAHYLGVSKC